MTDAPITTVPFSIEAETSLLGSILVSPEIIPDINLDPEDFYIQRHGIILHAARSLYSSGNAIDLVSLTEVLKRKELLEEIGGMAYLASLIQETPSSMNFRTYASIVRDSSTRRKVIQCANDLAKRAFDQANPLLIMDILEVLEKGESKSRSSAHISDWTGSVWNEIEARIDNPKDVWGIPTKILDLDRLLGGINSGEWILLSGEPGIGKSRLALQMSVNLAETAPGVYFSQEMSANALVRRAISGISGVPTRRLLTGKLMDDDYSNIAQAVEKLATLPIYLRDGDIDPAGMKSELAWLIHKYGVKWFILDYISLMSGFEKQTRDEYDRIGKLSTAIKRICNDFGLAGIGISSVVKEGMDTEKASIRNLQGSARLAHDADLAMILTSTAFDRVQLKIVKAREGDFGKATIELASRSGSMWFGNLEAKNVLERIKVK